MSSNKGRKIHASENSIIALNSNRFKPTSESAKKGAETKRRNRTMRETIALMFDSKCVNPSDVRMLKAMGFTDATLKDEVAMRSFQNLMQGKKIDMDFLKYALSCIGETVEDTPETNQSKVDPIESLNKELDKVSVEGIEEDEV